MAQRTGALVFDELTDRYDIRFDLSDYYGGLHCGDCLEVFVRGKWKPTRMEYGQNWYLVGVRAEDLNGLILSDTELYANEFDLLINTLPLPIFAMLLSQYPNDDFLDRESEQLLFAALQKRKQRISTEEMQQIEHFISTLQREEM